MPFIWHYRNSGRPLIEGAILDQIFIQTGMRVEVIDMPKEVYFKYALVYYEMMYHHKATDEDTACLFADVTSGGLV